MRLILVLHRYLGVAVGLLMTLWCLSGFVMMYQGYPHLAEADRLKSLQPIRFASPPLASAVGDDEPLTAFQIEMLAGRPVLRATLGARAEGLVDLGTGDARVGLEPADVQAIARVYGEGVGIKDDPRDLGLIPVDQWTLEGAGRTGPVHHVRFGDPMGSEIYIADRSGQVVQATTRRSRFWGWLGAVPHWIYPTILRRDVALWDAVVVWSAIVGCFLTLTGLYVGITRFRRRPSGRWSPYRGWFYWHHVTGLIFGVLTLTWVASGLLTMTPWGLLDTPVAGVERRRLAGEISGAMAKAFLTQAPTVAAATDAVELRSAPLGGRLYVLAIGRDGHAVRFDVEGRPAPLREADVVESVRRGAPAPIADVSLMKTEDAYYYSGYDEAARLPVYRVRLGDAEATTLYIDPDTGELLRATDRAARAGRWLRTGLHDWDFAWLRGRPAWDVTVLVLLAGVTASCAIGAWLGLRRLGRDLAGLRRRL